MLDRLLRLLGLGAPAPGTPAKPPGGETGGAGRKARAGKGEGGGKRRSGDGEGPAARRSRTGKDGVGKGGDGKSSAGKGGAGKGGGGSRDRGKRRAGGAEGEGVGKARAGGDRAARKAGGPARKRARDDAAPAADALAARAARRRRRMEKTGRVPGGPPAPTPKDPLGRPTVHVLHIRKTAGTALKATLKPLQKEGTDDYALRCCPHRFTLEHLPEGDKLVAVVRDPVDRFVSGFFSRLREGLPRYHNPWNRAEKRAFERFSTPESLALGLRAADPETREAAEAAMRGVTHLRSSLWDWFVSEEAVRARKDDMLMLMRQERLADDFARFVARVGLPDGTRLPEDDARAHRNSYDDDATISEEAAAILQDWYARDYAFLRFAEAELGLAPLEGPTGWQKRLTRAGA